MKIILGKNDTGKTRALIEQSLVQDIPIFALSRSKADSLQAKSISYFGKLVKVVTADDLTCHSYSGDILVDDMEKLFTTLLSAYTKCQDFNIVAATVTED